MDPLPKLPGRLGSLTCEEVLTKRPGDTGDHFWLKVQKDGLGTRQVREAIARSVNADPALVSDAGNRDRQGVCVQWFSIPVAAVDHPGPLRRAGAHGKMRVLELTTSHKPFTEANVERLRWRAVLKGANRDGGYTRAKPMLDRLRVAGVPNWVPASRLGTDGSWARWGRVLLKGERLPAAVSKRGEITPGVCLAAIQGWLFNRWLAARITDGLFGRTIAGDRIRSRLGHEELVTDTAHADRRLETWEAVVLGPLYGAAMSAVEGSAAERETAVLADSDLGQAEVGTLHGSRRAAWFQPQKVMLDLEGNDLLLTAEIPTDASIQVLIDELIDGVG